MIWICLQVVCLLIIQATPHHHTFGVEKIYLTLLLGFELLWLAQRRLPTLNLLATLSFSALLGCTTMIVLTNGGVPLSLCWPALALRWEDDHPTQSRWALIGCFAALAWGTSQQPWFAFVPVLLTLWQFKPNRIARLCNTAALAWTLAALAEVYGASDPEATLRTGLLLVLLQIGLRWVNRDQG